MSDARLARAQAQLADLGMAQNANGIWRPQNSQRWQNDVDKSGKRGTTMSDKKRNWTPVGQGDFLKWETKGQEIEGVWRGQRDGQFGPLGTVLTDEGELTSFPLHTALLQRVDGIEKGTYIKIQYNGKKKNKEGTREYKDFSVWMAPDESPRQHSDREEPVTGDDVPF